MNLKTERPESEEKAANLITQKVALVSGLEGDARRPNLHADKLMTNKLVPPPSTPEKKSTMDFFSRAPSEAVRHVIELKYANFIAAEKMGRKISSKSQTFFFLFA